MPCGHGPRRALLRACTGLCGECLRRAGGVGSRCASAWRGVLRRVHGEYRDQYYCCPVARDPNLCASGDQLVPLLAFVCLQLMDGLTTVVFLRSGVEEGNPLIRVALAAFGQSAWALVAPKALAILLGVYAWRSGRMGLLRKMNLLFAACVVWNVAAIFRAG